MSFHRRVTLRCVDEDLTSWTVASHAAFASSLVAVARAAVRGDADKANLGQVLRGGPHLSQLGHPIIRHFDSSFDADNAEVQRESISAVTDRLWWKVKSGRWRGAAHHASESDLVWLAAAGLRSSGSRDDFYEKFERRCAAGSGSFLPDESDFLVLRVEQELAVLSAWKLQLQASILMMIGHELKGVGTTEPLEVQHPSKDERVGRVWVSAEGISEGHEQLTEVVVTASVELGSAQVWRDLITQIVIGTLSPRAEDVRVAPVGPQGEFALSFGAYVDSELVGEIQRVLAGERPLRLSNDLHHGTVAHFSYRDHLMQATVEGYPVEALCGHWFVPSSDFVDKAQCTVCQERYETLPGRDDTA